LKFSSRKKLSW